MTLKSRTAPSSARIDGSAIQSLPVGMTSPEARLSGISRAAGGAAVAPVARAAASSRAIGLTLLPLDRARRLRGIIVDDPVDAVDLIDDAGRTAAQELGVERIDVRGHPIE